MNGCMYGSTYTHPLAQMTNSRCWRENTASSFHKPKHKELAPRKLKQRDQEKHFKTDKLPFVKGLGNTCTRDF